MTEDERRSLEDDERRRARSDALSDLAARVIRAGTEAVVTTSEKIREKGEEFKPRELLGNAAQLTARGKDELVTLIAKEVRTYLDKLEVVDEIAKFLSSHELEVQAKFRLRPLAEKKPEPEGD